MKNDDLGYQLKDKLEEIFSDIQGFKARNDERLKEVEKTLAQVETVLGRGGHGGGSDYNGGTGLQPEPSSLAFIDKDGKRLPVYAKGDSIAAAYPKSTEDTWSLADYVSCNMGISVKNSVLERGAATVPTFVSANIIDMMRARTRIIQAGANTIEIDGETKLARITADPTVVEHVEAANDITESIPTFLPITLNPKTLAVLIPVSHELVMDSPNLDVALKAAIAGAFAAKIDALGLAAILADSNIPDSAIGQDPATWAGTLAAVGAGMGLNQDIPSALISAPADFIARAGQLASTGGQWLGCPPALTNMVDLPTTAMAAGTAVFGNFSMGIGVAVRQMLGVELIRFGKPTYGSHLLIAHARIAPYVLQPGALFIQKKIV